MARRHARFAGADTVVLRLALVALAAGGAVACGPADVIEQRVEAARAAAEIFETPEPISTRQLQVGDVAEFLAAHPQYATDSTALRDFYARRDAQYAWLAADGITASAEAFIALAGLGPGAMDTLDVSCDRCVRDAELTLTAEFYRFAARDYGGHFARDPREVDWFIPRAKKDYGALLDSLAAGTMDLAAIAPVHPMYEPLRASLATLRALDTLPWPSLVLPDGARKLSPGDSAQVVAAIAERLALLGDLADPVPARTIYDSVLVAAVRRFQERHGLSPDGIVGAGVLRALNVPPAERERTVLVNMERLRWVPERPPPTVIIVNIPEFRLHVLENGTEVLTMPIVVGASATRTVVFADSVTQIVFSPTWTVPMSITRNEILPAMRRDPGYLARHDMEIIGGTPALPVIRQRPGPQNALGAVKFVFPNQYSIYMHDTPSRGLFAREQRAFSHGCIRLGDPTALAAYLLQSDSTWTDERMRTAMRQRTETTVTLREPMPVYLVYFTAWVGSDGVLQFRDDVYGHDARLAAELFASAS